MTCKGNGLRASRFNLLLAVLVVSGLLFGFQPVDAASPWTDSDLTQQAVPRFEPAACMVEMPVGYVEGQDVECGWLIVPEEYDQPQGATIRLAVVVIKSQSEDPAPDPLVMAQGGPGGSTIETYLQAIPLAAPHLRANRDIILFDQRGTLYSDPALTCPEYLDMMTEYLDQDLTDEEILELTLESMQDCRDRLVNEGVNLSAFDSLENAADVESLRAAMGYEQINLYGVSYGTLLAQHVMRLYPQGLRSVVLDSVVPTNINFLTGAPQTQFRSFRGLFEACRMDADCSATFPNLEEVFFEQVDRLNEDPAWMRLTDMETQETYPAIMDGDTFRSAVFQLMYVTDLIPFMPRIIYDARTNNFDFLARIYSILVFDRSSSLGMYYTVICAEDADFTAEDVNVEGLPPQIAEDEQLRAEYIQRTCAVWDVETLSGPVDEPVASDIPTLLLSGELDPVTPPEYAEETASHLAHQFSFVVPWGGHGAVASSECADRIMLAFLDNPNQEPDGSCLNAMRDLEFVTPGTLVRLPVLSKLVNLEGGTAVQLVLFVLALLFLLTALVIYPIVWLVRKLSGRTAAPAAAPLASPYPGDPLQPQANMGITASTEPERPRGIYRLAPWLSGINALVLLAFTILLVAVIVNLVLSNDYRILLGFPGSARPMFVLPLLSAILTVLMLGALLFAWSGRLGSAWGRVYFTLLTLAALACLTVLGIWGMLTGLVA